MTLSPRTTSLVITISTIGIVAIAGFVTLPKDDHPLMLQAGLLEHQYGSVNVITGTLEGSEEAVIPVGKRGLITCPVSIPSTMDWNNSATLTGVSGMRMYEYSQNFSVEKEPGTRVWSGRKLSSGVTGSERIDTILPGRTYYIRANSEVHFRCAVDKTLFITETDLDAHRTFTLNRDLATLGSAIFVMAPHATIDLNGHTVTFGLDDRNGTIGVYPFYARTSQLLGSDDVNFPQTAGGGNGTDGVTIENGHVAWGGKNGTNAVAVGTHYAGGTDQPWLLNNLSLESGGKDGMCVLISWNEVTVTNTLCNDTSNTTFNRDLLPAGIRVPGNKLTAYHNIVFGGNGGIVGGANSVIRENVIRNDGFVTNGYSANPGPHSLTERNIIAPRNGRGIYMNGPSTSQDNVIIVHEKPNAEFGMSLDPPCVRIRWANVDNVVQRNTCLGIAGSPNTSTSGLYLSNYGSGTNTVTNNRFIAINTQDDPTGAIYANAVTFEGQGANGFMHDTILQNSFSTNQYQIRLSGYDGHTWEDGMIAGNSFSWINGLDAANEMEAALQQSMFNFTYDPSNTYVTPALLASTKNDIVQEMHILLDVIPSRMNSATFYTGYCCGHDSIIMLLDNILATGVTMQSNDVAMGNPTAGGQVNIRIGHSLWVEARNGTDILWKEPIQVRDSSGVIGTYTTDGSGRVRIPMIEYSLERDPGSGTNRKVLHTAHTIIWGSTERPLSLSAQGTETQPLVVNF